MIRLPFTCLMMISRVWSLFKLMTFCKPVRVTFFKIVFKTNEHNVIYLMKGLIADARKRWPNPCAYLHTIPLSNRLFVGIEKELRNHLERRRKTGTGSKTWYPSSGWCWLLDHQRISIGTTQSPPVEALWASIKGLKGALNKVNDISRTWVMPPATEDAGDMRSF